MAAYTIEDIEMIRRKSGISYQEAVSLLDYHNGNVARALVDLERNGRIKPEAARTAKTESGASTTSKSGKNGFVDLCSKLYRFRVKISKDGTNVLNLSALFGIVSLLISPHLVIIGAIVSLILGYKFSFTKNDPDFASEDLEKMVRNAADNVKSSVGDIARGFQSETASSASADSKEASADESAPSYYATRGAASAAYHRPSVPTINVPVQVESQDGSVSMDSDDEGYTSATIE